MKLKKNMFVALLPLAALLSLALLGCPQPTATDDGGNTGGGDTGPTPVIFTDFESDLGGWQGNGGATAELSTEQKKNGTQSCKVISGDAGWKSAWMYNLGSTILNDVAYNYSVWVYQESGQEVLFSITLKDSNEGYNSVKYQAPIPSGQWTEIAATYALPTANGTADSMYIEPSVINTTFYFDDFKVVAAE